MSSSKAPGEKPDAPRWRSTACILSPMNCGLQVRVEGGRLTKIRGDKRHPVSRGYH